MGQLGEQRGQLSLLATQLKTLADLYSFLPSPRLARPFLATDRAWQSSKDPFPLLELAQLLAAFQGVQTSMEKVTTAHTADRKKGGHMAQPHPGRRGWQDMARLARG